MRWVMSLALKKCTVILSNVDRLPSKFNILSKFHMSLALNSSTLLLANRTLSHYSGELDTPCTFGNITLPGQAERKRQDTFTGRLGNQAGGVAAQSTYALVLPYHTDPLTRPQNLFDCIDDALIQC
jgi:hypothetical protein